MSVTIRSVYTRIFNAKKNVFAIKACLEMGFAKKNVIQMLVFGTNTTVSLTFAETVLQLQSMITIVIIIAMKKLADGMEVIVLKKILNVSLKIIVFNNELEIADVIEHVIMKNAIEMVEIANGKPFFKINLIFLISQNCQSQKM